MLRLLRLICLFAPDDGAGGGSANDAGAGGNSADASGGGNAGTNASGSGNAGSHAGSGTADSERRFTQAELDRVISDRLKREREGWQKELDEKTKLAQMSEAERLQKEIADRDAALIRASDEHRAQLLRLSARSEALALGIRPEHVDDAIRLADLTNVAYDGISPDPVGIQSALKTVLTRLPALSGGSSAAGASMGGNVDDNKILSLDEMRQLAQANPAEYQRRYPSWLKARKSNDRW